MSIDKAVPGIFKAMAASDNLLQSFSLSRNLQELIRIRVSQINGCGYCINSHTKDAQKLGESTQRLFALSAWWETPFFTEEEQAVLKLAEQVTNIANGGVNDAVFENARQKLGEQKVAEIIFVTCTINSWNRIAISMHMVAEKE